MPPLVLVCVAWLAGLIAAHHWLVPASIRPESVALLELIPLVGLLLWPRDKRILLGAICSGALLAGVLRYQASVPDISDPAFIAHYNDQGWVSFEASVRGYPDVRDTWTNLLVAVEQITINGRKYPVTGQVMVRSPRYPEHHYGDRLLISGYLETPPEWEGFSFRRYLARRGIYSYVGWPRISKLAGGEGHPLLAALYSVRDKARDLISRLVPDPEASVLQGILLGIESSIPKDLANDYRATGTSHIIVISGANITIVAALLSQSLGRLLGKRKAFWLSLGGIVLYVLLVGADAVVVRAGTMGCLYILARYLGRQATAYVSLFASAMLLTLVNPSALWDIGFQLSFASTLGLVLFAGPLEGLLERLLGGAMSQARARQFVSILADVLIVTLAAQILTAPLVAYHFGRVSLVAPLANLLILPVQPVIMILGGTAAIIGLFPPLEPVAQMLGWAPWLLLAYTHAVVRWMANWPMASIAAGTAGPIWLGLTYLVAAGATWLVGRRRALRLSHSGGRREFRRDRVLAGASGIVAILVWLAALQLPDGRLHVAFLDVGQGDAVLITTPRGLQILVDGGPSPSALTKALGAEMAFWDRSLDLVIVTHPDADHVAGLPEVLKRFDVALWWDNGSGSTEGTYRQSLALLDSEGVQRQCVESGTSLDLGDGLELRVLHPPLGGCEIPNDDNNASIVLRVAWGRASFLLTGDIEAQAEGEIVTAGHSLGAQVLKIAHHGSGGSSSARFLDAVGPRYAVISVGEGNRVGHPHPDVLGRLSQRGGTTILRTDQDGTIEFITDGQRLWVRTGR